MILLIFVHFFLRLYYCEIPFCYNAVCFACSDSMGKKYYIGRATWVFALLVVVSIHYH